MAVSKTATNNQFARTSLTGLRTVPLPGGPDQGIEPLADEHGRLWVRPIGVVPDPLPNTFQSIVIAQAQFIAIASEARLQNLIGYIRNMAALPFWIHIFNFNAAPILGQGPDIILPMAANQIEFSLAIPYYFNVGIVVAPSTTELTFTPDAGATMVGTAVMSVP